MEEWAEGVSVHGKAGAEVSRRSRTHPSSGRVKDEEGGGLVAHHGAPYLEEQVARGQQRHGDDHLHPILQHLAADRPA